MINWKTTLSGAITMAAAAALTVPSLAPYAQIIGMVSAGLTGLLAKDAAVTGGTISAVTGTAVSHPVSMI